MRAIQQRIEVLDRLHAYERELMMKKSADYSGAQDCNKNIKACEVMGITDKYTGLLIRMFDKMQRIVTLSKQDAQVVDESKKDTLHDLRNYAAIYIDLMEEDAERERAAAPVN